MKLKPGGTALLNITRASQPFGFRRFYSFSFVIAHIGISLIYHLMRAPLLFFCFFCLKDKGYPFSYVPVPVQAQTNSNTL